VTDYETIKFEQAGPITRITLNRSDAANGMNATMTRELAHAAARCDTEATKVVVLTGSGRFFCAGGDLKSFASAPSRGRFIKGIADEGASSAIVQAVVNIAAASNMMTTAEGVEQEWQRELLRELGCNEMQGYLFSPAIPATDVRRLLLSHRDRAVSAA